MKIQPNLKKDKIFFLFFLMLINSGCRNVQLSQQITTFFNYKLNDDILNSIGDARANYHMKYLLDTIIKKNYTRSDYDYKYCIFSFYEFSLTSSAIFIDSNDTIWYRLKEIDISEKRIGAIHGIYKMGDDIKHIYYKIIEKRLTYNDIKDHCMYKIFFEKTNCLNADSILYSGPKEEMVLKFWNKKGS